MTTATDNARSLENLATPVNRKSPMPAWAQVRRDLETLINQGFKVGEQLPTETDMAAIYGVSRITIRQALASLAQEGYVQRRHGTGTFVADRPQLVQHDFGLMTPWRDRFRAAGEDAVSIHLQDRSPEPELYDLTRELTSAEREMSRLHLKRLHKVNGRPIGLTDSWVAGRTADLLTGVTLMEGSLSKTLDSLGVVVTETHHFLEVRAVSQAEAHLLQTTEDGNVFVDWSIARHEGELIETSRTIWLGSRVRFHYKANF